MKKKNAIFSLVREQSLFMTVIVAILTFLAVVALGLVLSIGTGVVRWNNQWANFATIQTKTNIDGIEKVLNANRDKIKNIKKLSDSEMNDLMRPWTSGGNVLQNYIPTMWEVEFESKKSMDDVAKQIATTARFMPHTDAIRTPISTGWKLVIISSLILLIVLGAIGMCVLYTAQNIAMLHKREIEILNQIGATDSFISKQMQMIIAKITAKACAIGFACAAPIIMLILSIAHNARTGLMTMIGLSGMEWLFLLLLPMAIIALSTIITNRTTLKILAK